MSRLIAVFLAIVLASITIVIAKSSTWEHSRGPVIFQIRETNVECINQQGELQQYLPFIIRNEHTYYSGPWEEEPNSPYTLANGPIGPGEEYFGYPNDLSDYWSYYATSNGPMIITLDNFSANGGQLQLFYQIASEATRVAYDLTAPYQINYSGPAGLYYIFIAAESGSNTVAPYTLLARFPSTTAVYGENSADGSLITHQQNWIGFDFETGVDNWTTSEGEYKLAELDTSRNVVCVGNQSLELTTELYISQDHVTRHTEAVAYFSSAIPSGMNGPGPYNLESKKVSCNVLLPQGLVSEGNPQAYVRLFVKDVKHANQYGGALDATNLTVNTWQQLSLTVAQIDGTFDPTQINALGVRLDLQDGATLDFEGEIYIDGCEIEQ